MPKLRSYKRKRHSLAKTIQCRRRSARLKKEAEVPNGELSDEMEYRNFTDALVSDGNSASINNFIIQRTSTALMPACRLETADVKDQPCNLNTSDIKTEPKEIVDNSVTKEVCLSDVNCHSYTVREQSEKNIMKLKKLAEEKIPGIHDIPEIRIKTEPISPVSSPKPTIPTATADDENQPPNLNVSHIKTEPEENIDNSVTKETYKSNVNGHSYPATESCDKNILKLKRLAEENIPDADSEPLSKKIKVEPISPVSSPKPTIPIVAGDKPVNLITTIENNSTQSHSNTNHSVFIEPSIAEPCNLEAHYQVKAVNLSFGDDTTTHALTKRIKAEPITPPHSPIRKSKSFDPEINRDVNIKVENSSFDENISVHEHETAQVCINIKKDCEKDRKFTAVDTNMSQTASVNISSPNNNTLHTPTANLKSSSSYSSQKFILNSSSVDYKKYLFLNVDYNENDILECITYISNKYPCRSSMDIFYDEEEEIEAVDNKNKQTMSSRTIDVIIGNRQYNDNNYHSVKRQAAVYNYESTPTESLSMNNDHQNVPIDISNEELLSIIQQASVNFSSNPSPSADSNFNVSGHSEPKSRYTDRETSKDTPSRYSSHKNNLKDINVVHKKSNNDAMESGSPYMNDMNMLALKAPASETRYLQDHSSIPVDPRRVRSINKSNPHHSVHANSFTEIQSEQSLSSIQTEKSFLPATPSYSDSLTFAFQQSLSNESSITKPYFHHTSAASEVSKNADGNRLSDLTSPVRNIHMLPSETSVSTKNYLKSHSSIPGDPRLKKTSNSHHSVNTATSFSVKTTPPSRSSTTNMHHPVSTARNSAATSPSTIANIRRASSSCHYRDTSSVSPYSSMFPSRVGNPEERTKSAYKNVGKRFFGEIDIYNLIVEWNAKWLQIQKQSGVCAPICDYPSEKGQKQSKKDQYPSVKPSYENIEEHYNTYFPLHLLNIWINMFEAWEQSHTILPATLQKYEEKSHHVKIEFTSILPRDEFSICDVILISSKDNRQQLLGYVYSTLSRPVHSNDPRESLKQLKIKCVVVEKPKFKPEEDFNIKKLYKIRVELKQNDALLALKTSRRKNLILHPHMFKSKIEIVALPNSWDFCLIPTWANKILNCTMASENHITIVHSPPNNRIAVISKLVGSLMTKQPVLICLRTEENLFNLAKHFPFRHLTLAIKESEVNVPVNFRQFLLRERARAEKCVEDIILRKSVVILTILSKLYLSDNAKLFENSNLACIVDEANLCTETETLLPICYYDPKYVVLMGEFEIKSDTMNAHLQKYNYNTSLYERLYQAKCNG